ncbi:MAG: sulfotransferase, partial [Ilumatobacteraceae bacterium]
SAFFGTLHRRAPCGSLDDPAEVFFGLPDPVREVRGRVPAHRFHELHHDDLVADPTGTLADLCGFLGLSTPPDYLTDCASIVYESPNRSRTTLGWSPELVARIAIRSAQHPSLSRYRMDDLAASGEAS